VRDVPLRARERPIRNLPTRTESASNTRVELGIFRRRTIWWPTWKGWLLFIAVFVAPVIGWTFCGETYLSHTERVSPDTLAVESWIQEDGIHAAAEEYRTKGYRHLVISGGFTGTKGTLRRQSYTTRAERVLIEAGIPKEAIIEASTPDVETHRTYTMAVSIRSALEQAGVKPTGVNVFTEGAHARRSRLVYAKVFGDNVKVGVISWAPWDNSAERWWSSSERTLDLFKETLGYPYEALFNSGRRS
jgi:hypothetical protein